MSARPGAADPLARLVAPRADLPRVDRPRIAYLLASEPRSGSTLLCGLLTQTGVAGVPLEYLHLRAVPRAMAALGLDDLDGYLAEVMARRTTPNGVFGMKAHFEQIANLLRRSRAGLPPDLRILALTRRDAVAQAVSLYLAIRTGRWQAAGQAPAEHALAYDFAGISRALDSVVIERRNWQQLFRQAGIAPPILAYEALTADPAAAVDGVLRWLGVAADPAARRAAALPQRQATACSAEWAARFRAEANARGMVLP